MNPPRYQSPIALNFDDLIYICQELKIKGKNKGATYNSVDRIFEVEDKIVLKVNDVFYSLVEYHFHVPGEHTINGKEYPSEVHYVFYQMDHEKDYKKCKGDVCGTGGINGGTTTTNKTNNNDEKILVIGRVIRNGCNKNNLNKLQVNLPSSYFEYDGTLTGQSIEDKTTPVRWIVGRKYIRLPLEKIESIAKTSKHLSPLDNRIIMFSC